MAVQKLIPQLQQGNTKPFKLLRVQVTVPQYKILNSEENN